MAVHKDDWEDFKSLGVQRSRSKEYGPESDVQ